MGLVAGLSEFVVATMGSLGYGGLFLLMLLESTLVPVPSTVVMGFAGFLAWRGTFTLPLVLLVTLAGTLAGSLLSYALGYFGGRPLVQRHGRWFLVGPLALEAAERFFARWGALAVLLGRFLPAVRHAISIPAGTARMPLPRFLAATAAGAMAWNGFLAVVGYSLGPEWEALLEFAAPYEALLLAAALVAAALLVAWRVRRLRSASTQAARGPGPGS